jgi:pimeloyl-ACP methyl ester carboxylesterase
LVGTVPTWTERYVDTNGVRLRVTEAGHPGDPVVLLAHGFPELAYSWRHQLPALAAAGYHVLAPDQRGYGGSSRPPAVEDYDIHALTGDLVGLLDDVGAKTAVVIGHDWGAAVSWNTALLHPDRVRTVAGLSVRPTPRGKTAPTDAMRHLYGDDFYMVKLQEPGVLDARFGRDPRATLRSVFAGGTELFDPGFEPAAGLRPLPGWLTDDEFEHYVSAFTRTGFTGAINWYRNLDRNWRLTEAIAGRTIDVPALYIAGGADPIPNTGTPERAARIATDYREITVDGAGHSVQQQAADRVNRILVDFLSANER